MENSHKIITIDCLQALHDLIIENEIVTLDLRNCTSKFIGREIANKLCNLDENKILYVIISNKCCFFEILNRLKKQGKDVFIQKLSVQPIAIPIDNALPMLVHDSYNILEQLHALNESHPALLGKFHTRLKQLKPVKKNLNVSEINDVGTSARSKRRSGIKTLKDLTTETDSSNDECKSKKRGKKKLKTSPTSEAATVTMNNVKGDITDIVCYMCKGRHSFSPKLCNSCSIYNSKMRENHADLQGKYAIVTGARVKIGLEVAHRLLQDGCYVIVTTRFPYNARESYKQFPDYDVWKDRVQFKKLDLLEMSSIESFIEWVQNEIPYLDILINNAAQTIWRPSKFYDNLNKLELEYKKQEKTEAIPHSENATYVIDECEPDKKRLKLDLQNSFSLVPVLSQYKKNEMFPSMTHNNEAWFPKGLKADDGQQLDLRPMNSWKLGVTEIPLSELLQCLAVNSVAPFILISQLKQLLLKSPCKRKFVVNVSAMEGQFSRISKGPHHPHTNMAKAALNMLTRTTGMEFQQENIYMTAVDTGWCTDERPHGQLQHEKYTNGFILPLTPADGAARVYHPIVHGLTEQNTPYFSVFLKDFKVHPW